MLAGYKDLGTFFIVMLLCSCKGEVGVSDILSSAPMYWGYVLLGPSHLLTDCPLLLFLADLFNKIFLISLYSAGKV